jgi:Kef-type K+ transport system membrane component KefB
LIAVTGVAAPIAIAFGFFHAILGFSLTASAVGGVALASTSAGTSIRILTDSRLLATPVGTHVLSAAMLDDVMSLFALSVVLAVGPALATNDSSRLALAATMPIVTAIALLIGIILIHRFVLPTMMQRSKSVAASLVLLFFTGFTVAIVVLVWFVGGSPFVAAFACGVSFGDSIRSTWNDKCGPHVRLMQRIFFLGTGAALPIRALFSSHDLLFGFIYSLLSLASKAVCGLAYWPDFWTVSLAMIARGDLGFLMLSSAASVNIIDSSLAAICVWALISNTLVGPLLLSLFLRRKRTQKAVTAEQFDAGFHSANDDDDDDDELI